MKKIVFFVLAVIINGQLFSQNYEAIVNAEVVNFHGLDFSRAKLIGSKGFTKVDEIVDGHIKGGWNALLFDEWKKYNISGALNNKEVRYFPDVANERNNEVSNEGLVIDKSYDLEEKDIRSIISEYPKREVKGISLVMVVESFNKAFEKSSLWIVFFDENSGEILLAQEFVGKPMGVGVEDYWANSVWDIIRQIKKENKGWEKKVSGKGLKLIKKKK